MTAPNDGGPAFPCSNEQFTHGNPQTGDAWPGLSLRDWFAGQVIASARRLPTGPSECEERAKVAYAQADALLAARATQDRS